MINSAFLLKTFNKVHLNNLSKHLTVRLFSSKNIDSSQIPKNLVKDLHSASDQPENGIVYDKKPFRVTLEAGKKYCWCLCGKSKSQPFCDGTHKDVFLKIKQRPIRFVVEESKDYWLCNCKHTTNRPFCDGTHKQNHIQDGSSVVRT